ncbi:MAG: helix-turn-helix domain-containing protein, partial [Lachnospiraceae bacterium]|nr:helix-turn-helix domain-containing protein [Lachnospiraceae bacterium]
MITVGDLIEKERARVGVSREKLASGICTQQALYRVGVEDSVTDVLTFEILFERMGQSVDSLEYILSREEYDKILMRDEIEDRIMCGNAVDAKSMLDKYKLLYGELEGTEEMYYYRTLAAIELYCGDNILEYKEGLQYILKAIKLTLNGVNRYNYTEYLYSTYEVENILMYIKALCMTGKVKKGVDLLIECFVYLVGKWSDETLKVRVLPKCVYLMVEYGESIIENETLVTYLEKGIDLLRANSIIYMLKPLVEKLIESYKRVGDRDKVDYWMSYFNLLYELYNEYDNGRRQDALFYRWTTASYYLESEVIRDERVAQGMTQMELADGIYKNIASVSNIEKGKSSPNKNKYKAIVEKLSINKERISGFVIADSLKRIRQIAEIKEMTARGETAKVLELTEERPDQSEKEKRLFKAYRGIVQYEGVTDKNIKLEAMKENVKGIYDLEREEYIRRPFQAEMDIITAYLANLRQIDGANTDIIADKLLKLYKDTKVDLRYCYRQYTSVYLLGIGKDKKSKINNPNKAEHDFIQYCVDTGKGSALVGLNWWT